MAKGKLIIKDVKTGDETIEYLVTNFKNGNGVWNIKLPSFVFEVIHPGDMNLPEREEITVEVSNEEIIKKLKQLNFKEITYED